LNTVILPAAIALPRNLDHRRKTQRPCHRFRRNPQTLLAELEAQLIQSTLPPEKKEKLDFVTPPAILNALRPLFRW
jgi:hypothetical protein